MMRVLTALKIGEEAGKNSYASNAVAEALVTPEQKAGMRWRYIFTYSVASL